MFYVLPDDPNCPECRARMWSRTARHTRECQTCGFVQRLKTIDEDWAHLQAEIDAEIASGG